jgi:hypothetical protein
MVHKITTYTESLDGSDKRKIFVTTDAIPLRVNSELIIEIRGVSYFDNE